MNGCQFVKLKHFLGCETIHGKYLMPSFGGIRIYEDCDKNELSYAEIGFNYYEPPKEFRDLNYDRKTFLAGE